MNNLNIDGYRGGRVAVWSLHGNDLTFGQSILACAISVILRFLKISNLVRNPFDKRADGRIDRRKSKSNPNVVCGFPISQNAREEAPFF